MLEKNFFESNFIQKIFRTSLILFLLSFSTISLFAQDFLDNGYLTLQRGDINALQQAYPDFADLDKDGDLDLYIANQLGDILIFTNDGSGNFAKNGKLQADGSDINEGGYICLKFADFDADNDLDLFIGHGNGTVTYYNNTGGGTFTKVGNMQADGSDINVGAYSFPAFADIDKDGDLDLYVGNQAGNIKIYTNNGSNVFSAAGNLQADASDIDVYSDATPVFEDLDGDGVLDMYVGNNQGYIYVFKNNGNGTFSAADKLKDGTDYIKVSGYSTPAFADIDGDSDLDLYIGSYEGFVYSFINDGSGNFSQTPAIQISDIELNVGQYSDPTFADIGNGKQLFVGDWAGNIKKYNIDASGNILFEENMQADASDIDVGYYSSPKFADLDSANGLDLYVGDNDGYINVYTNDGSNNFTNAGRLQASGADIKVDGRAKPVFEDIDGDNDLDLYVGTYQGYIEVFTNDGQNNFSAAGKLQADGANLDIGLYASPAFADFDEDGDLDLYVNEIYGKIRVYLNDGQGNFSYSDYLKINGVPLSANSYPTLCFDDFDDDGDLDLLCGGTFGLVDFFENITPVSITAQPSDLTDVCGATDVVFGIKADFATDYQWQVSTDNQISFNDITDNPIYSGTNRDTLHITTDASINNSFFRCIVINGNKNDTSDAVSFSLESENPVVTCIVGSTVSISASENSFTISGTHFDPATSDNCSVASIVNDFNASASLNGATLPVGKTTVNWTTTDAAGNSTDCSFIITVQQTTKINETQNQTISVFPNPASDILFIATNDNSDYTQISISNISGQKVINQNFNNRRTNHIDLSSLAKGIYFVSVQTENKTETHKIIIK